MIITKEKAMEILANSSAYNAEEIKAAIKVLATKWVP